MGWTTNFALATRSRESAEWGGVDFAGKTVRLELPIHIDGDALRLRFANHYGECAARFEAAVELCGELLRLDFDGGEIPAGGELTSRELPIKLRAGDTLRVYIYCADDAEDRSGVYGGELCVGRRFGGMGVYCGETEDARRELNDWMRTRRHVDFAAAVEDAAKPGYMRGEYDSGDHLHPSKAGGLAMAAAIPDEYLR